jgi:hypothetical protein
MPEFERICTINIYMIYKIDNSRKITHVLTLSAPIATGHCTFMDMNVSTK